MLRLAFSTNAFKKNTLEEAIEAIAGIGYRGVELMADVPHAYPPHMPPERRDRVGRQIAKPGLAVSNINAFTLFACGDTYRPTWIEDDLGRRNARIEHTRAAIELRGNSAPAPSAFSPAGR